MYDNESFNPRAPCGARPKTRDIYGSCQVFQSTRPVWGATCADSRDRRADAVSIHAPRVGRDHHRTRPAFGGQVSIHAPRVGRDLAHELGHMQMHRFNPRAPCGARPALHFAVKSGGRVSIHAPRVGRDHGKYDAAFDCTVSIHAPRVGRDRSFSIQPCSAMPFQSTRPVWGATFSATSRPCASSFQSTRPVWGATAEVLRRDKFGVVSIHAPRVGRDLAPAA